MNPGRCLQDKPVSADVDAASLAKRTAGFSGAELSNLVNEAALAAGKGGLPKITSSLLDEAQDKVLMGSERRCACDTQHDMSVTVGVKTFLNRHFTAGLTLACGELSPQVFRCRSCLQVHGEDSRVSEADGLS